jgi:hypothetical protein
VRITGGTCAAAAAWSAAVAVVSKSNEGGGSKTGARNSLGAFNMRLAESAARLLASSAEFIDASSEGRSQLDIGVQHLEGEREAKGCCGQWSHACPALRILECSTTTLVTKQDWHLEERV